MYGEEMVTINIPAGVQEGMQLSMDLYNRHKQDYFFVVASTNLGVTGEFAFK